MKKKMESYRVPKGTVQCIEPYGNLYSDAYQSLSSITLVNVYVDLVVFTRIAGTS